MKDSMKIDVTQLEPDQVSDVLARVRHYRSINQAAADGGNVRVDDESWQQAAFTGWTTEHVNLLRAHLNSRGKPVQLEAFDLAVKNGGFVSREEVYALGSYAPTRKLNNWTAPVNNYFQELVAHHGLPEDADLPIETEYGPGTGYRPAIGFSVAPEIVKLVRAS